MKLESNPNWPDWLKRDPKSGIWRVCAYDATKSPPRLDKTTKEKNSIERAKKIGKVIYETWLGHRLDGGAIRHLFSEVCDLKLEEMELRHKAKGKPRRSTINNALLHLGKSKDKDTGGEKLGDLRDEFGHFYVDQIEPDTLWQGFVARTLLERPGAKLYNQWKHMNMVMNYAHRRGMIKKAWDCENPDPEWDEQRLLSADEVSSIYNAAKQNLRDQMLFATTMGMRKREHLKLSWKAEHCCHVNLDAKTVTVCPAHNKNRKGRTIPMSTQVFAMLLRRKQGYYRHGRGKSEMWVFPSRGRATKPAHDNKTAWGNAKRQAGIKDPEVCKYHLLRHYFLSTCATLVKEGAVSMVLVCRYADVSIRTFERRYLHLRSDDMLPVAQLVAVKLGENDTSLEVRH